MNPSPEIAGIKTRLTRVFRAVVAAVALAVPQAAFAQSADIAVLHSRVDNIDATLARMDDKFTKRFERMDERLDRMDERFERMDGRLDRLEIIVARTDERINGLQSQVGLIVTVLIAVLVPLHLATLAALFALLTKGTFWGRGRATKVSASSPRGPSPQPAASPA